MKKTTAYTLTMEEYSKLIEKVSEGNIGVQHESGEWFYTVTEDAEGTDEEIYSLLNKELNITVSDVIVDITNLKVAIICE